MSNSNLSKKELIEKLDAISLLYDKTLYIKNKMGEYEPEDNYERTIEVPIFPGEYEKEEDREYFEEAIDHQEDDAVEQMSNIFERYYLPKQPKKPDFGTRPENYEKHFERSKGKFGCLFAIAIFAAVCSLISGGLFSDDATTKNINIIVLIVSAAITVICGLGMLIAVLSDKKATKAKINEYESIAKEKAIKYKQDMNAYQDSLNTFKLKKADFIDDYTNWRNVYLESLKEEFEIKLKLEMDRYEAIEKIRNEEYSPVWNELSNINDLISDDYLPVIDDIISLLKSGRADDLKEAINLYEDLVYRDKQLQLEIEIENQRRQEEEDRRLDEERRYQEEKRFRESQEQQRQYEERQRQRDAERRHKEEMDLLQKQERNRQFEENKRKDEERRRAEKAELARKQEESRATLNQCNTCALVTHCSMSFRRPNCASYKPR